MEPHSTSNASEFFTLAEDILTFEVDNRQRRKDKPERIIRRDFWQNVYLPRPDDHRRFDAFMDSDAHILFVTGHVGTGKSTFIRRKFEYERLTDKRCSGLIIDMRGKNHFFKPGISVENIFQDILYDAYLRALMLNFKAAILRGPGSKYQNHLYHTEADLPDLDDNEERAPTVVHQARQMLAIEAACLLNDYDQFAADLLDLFPTLDPNGATPFREQLEKLVDARNALKIKGLLKWEHLIALFILLDASPHPHAVVFDNLDRVEMPRIQEELLDEIENLLQRLNRIADEPFNLKQGSSVTKAIIAVRDENISRINIGGGGAKKIQHISMSSKDYRIPGNHEYDHMTIDLEFARRVVERRLDALDKSVSPENIKLFETYKSFIRQYWLSDEQLLIEIGNFNIKDLCNDSLRQMLEIIHRSTQSLILHLEQNHIPNEMLDRRFSYPMFRGKIIRSLWLHDSFKEIMVEFSNTLREERSSPFCCRLRLLLVYLGKQKNQQQTFQQLFNDFHQQFDLGEANCRERLWRLYNSRLKQGELITIYQPNIIDRPEAIQFDALIRLNAKGRVFFETIILNIDFYGLIAENRRPDEILPVLHEMTPHRAVGYLDKICDLVQKLSQQHLLYWQMELLPRVRRTKTETPFAVYSRRFAHGDCFHLERVCDSHRYSIKNYLLETLKAGETSSLLLSDADMDALRQSVGHNYYAENNLSPQNPDGPLHSILITHFPAQHDLNRIWRIYERYDEIKRNLENARLENPPMPDVATFDAVPIEKMLREDNIEEAIDMLLDYCNDNNFETKEIILLSGNIAAVERRFNKNQIGNKEVLATRSRTKEELLTIIRDIKRRSLGRD